MPVCLPSLQRTYLRLIRRLPHEHLRAFFRIKVTDDFRAIAKTGRAALQKRKIKRVSQDMRKIQAACEGDYKAFDHVLDLVYGRKGKIKWEIMKARYLGHFPPTLSPRADPSTEEARLLGPLSKRREVNTRWRYFVREWKKVYPPLQLILRDPSSGAESARPEDIHRVNIREVGAQGHGLFEEIEKLVGKPLSTRRLTRRERKTSEAADTPNAPVRHPSRWLRRRYQRLLGKLPVLAYTKGKNPNSGRYNVELSAMSLAHDLRTTFRQPEMDTDNLAWYELSKPKKSGG
ncbi:hypothetical protein AAF712_000715 [Marasmius tenuissimus]|uniref:LYR motif-containing protein Cup1-like N-terminal domain-containing protein n=1 Tax=Marasmius tenuissimus TaxID=585030 RepID=A0ABR3AFK4_9AGAR